MPRLRLAFVAAAVGLAVSAPSLVRAQTAADPSGHWEGAIEAPKGAVAFEIDLARNAAGVFTGAFSQPAEEIRGLPLSSVAVDGPAVRLVLKVGSGGGTFEGVVSADGRSMSGNFDANTPQGIVPVAFSATRTGEARFQTAPRNAPVGRDMEGTWAGAIAVGERQMHLVLKMSNQPDGTCAATLVSVDEDGMEMPVSVVQNARALTVDVRVTGATYAATLNADSTELAGTWNQRGAAVPLTLRRQK